MDMIRAENVSVSFGKLNVLKNVSISIHPQEVVCIIGPSGAGKSTMLRAFNHLEHINNGSIYIEDKLLTQHENGVRKLKINSKERREILLEVGMVFQRFNLFPHKTALENTMIAPMNVLKKSEAEARKKGIELLERVGLGDKLDAYPNKLSGGQQQRVAIARALVNEPKVLLLDEPLGALDLKLRKDMQQELKKIQKNTGITFIFVTHDQEEALSMSDTIVVMSEGKIQQIGTPTDIYNEPINAFVADFIGESNIVDGVMLEDYSVRFGGQTFHCLDCGFEKNEPVDVVIRPEDVDLVPAEQGQIQGTVTTVTFMGVHNEAIVDIDGFKWMIQTTDPVEEGAHVGIVLEPDAIHIMKKSKYSGMFGDYSSFSNELDELSNAGEDKEE